MYYYYYSLPPYCVCTGVYRCMMYCFFYGVEERERERERRKALEKKSLETF